MRNSRSRTAIGRYRSYRTTIGAFQIVQIVYDHVTAAFHYRSYRRGHYRTIGEGTIGLSELSDYYRTTIGVYYRNYRTRAQPETRRSPDGGCKD